MKTFKEFCEVIVGSKGIGQDYDDSNGHESYATPEYPDLESLPLSNEQIRNIHTVKERQTEFIPLHGRELSAKGCDVYQVDGILDGQPIKFTRYKYRY